MTDDDIARAKQAIRNRIWDLLEREGAAPPGVHGHIPDFIGAEQAAARLAELDIWKRARIIMANPDKAQLPVRIRALQDGKLLYMAVPRLAGPKPFYLLDPTVLTIPPEIAATSQGAATAALTINVDQMQPVDLIICGSVAVNHAGVRLGKGAGYSDTEIAMLTKAGLIGRRTAIVTTLHRLQVVDDDLPRNDHDFSVAVTITPDGLLHSQPPSL